MKTRGRLLAEKNARYCTRCIYDEFVPKITFDEKGVCNYCKMIDQVHSIYKAGTEAGEEEFSNIVEQIKKDGKNRKYDVVIGVSGGTDSSYMIYKAVQLGLRPLAVHYDNTWNSTIATENIRKVLQELNVDLYTYVVDNKEMDDIFRSFLLADVPDLDSPTDLALAEVLYRAASKFGVRYIFEGHSYKTEGISPLGYNYIDGQYIKSVHRQFGSMKMKTFPNMDFFSFMKWVAVKKIKKIRPLWYINYNKEAARKLLEEKFGWQYYGGHHLENRMTAFYHSYYNPVKFGVDQRNNALAASVRSGFKNREEAIKEYIEEPYMEPELLQYFLKRMKLTDAELDKILNGDRKDYKHYKTYKQRFEKLRPFFLHIGKGKPGSHEFLP